jgi:hypothetical protein
MNLQNRTIAVIGLGYVGLPLGAGEEGETDRQRPPSLRGPSGPVAINCALPQAKRTTAQRSFAVECGDRHVALRAPRDDGVLPVTPTGGAPGGARNDGFRYTALR